MMSKLGAMMIVIGACAGDSPTILAPIAVMAIGVVLMWKGGAFGGE